MSRVAERYFCKMYLFEYENNEFLLKSCLTTPFALKFDKI